YVAPNPLVGCVIVDQNNQIIADGYHHKHGDVHAEIDALNKCKNIDLRHAILYCNLEPCSHNSAKKINPPCSPAIIQSGIKKVVVGMVDPNPEVAGNGIKMLQKAGIEVIHGILEKECQELNRIFITNILKNKTHLLIKIAQTLDGKIATKTGDSKWITNINARKYVHELRAKYDAVMVGSNTAIIDNPKLDVRHVTGRNPKRIIIDSNLKIPLTHNLICDELKENTIIFTSNNLSSHQYQKYIDTGIKIIKCKSKDNYLDLNDILKKAYELKIYSILLEGGAGLITQFVKQKLFDEMMIFISPKIIGSGKESIGELNIDKINDAIEFSEVRYKQIDDQIIFNGVMRDVHRTD
ncbi:MAG: bifunctional diaminohydroxyphosphoribosylaminopyrimidine deaminase/5-amino-6-(5-phosphoribosylamino)uracil reductase RibD, partial [Candidatus Sericytochromatia bacterium]|nr:bifunctional diaminohydroxyphosphoribosylaminopyrimidine deaminase/5-amino-6-(5-phosphoribosylamino)uracil reductase RibD [Candidatus Sericytochromatia bacterium]